MPEQKPSHEVESIVRRALRQDCVEALSRSGEGFQNISAALRFLKNTVASIILKWKKFGTTKTLPRVGRPHNLGN
jgi:arginyl-tRNA synthetase